TKLDIPCQYGELVRVFILQQGDGTQILILAHHLAGDGKSIVYLIEDIMNALNGKHILYKEMRLLTTENLPRRSKIPLIMKPYINYFNSYWKRNRKVFSFHDIMTVHDIYWKQHKTVLRIEHFSNTELHQLRRKAKEADVRLTSYIIAAFCESKAERITTGLAVDGRVDGNRCMGNQATGITVDYRYRKSLNLTQNARRIQRKIDRKLQNTWKKYFVLKFLGLLDGTLIDAIYMYLSGIYRNHRIARFAKALGYGENSKDFSITNLTKLDIPCQYGSYRIKDFLFVPPIISYGKRLIGIATLGNEMYITYHLNEDSSTDSEVEQFNKVMERLKR
ncbi:MAG TPA: hypothetical protein VHQ24_07230, partial [Lachnospiraceae bacterium]|nr:hypothetical protein [Lachnospiraceae bacterium]